MCTLRVHARVESVKKVEGKLSFTGSDKFRMDSPLKFRSLRSVGIK